MRDWPPITEAELLERLALTDSEFDAFIRQHANFWGRREYKPEVLERALGYPWERPAGSYVLHGDSIDPLDRSDAGRRESAVIRFSKDRYPLLSFGSNAAPSGLTTKFAHFPDEADRTALVLTGELHDFDVGPSAELSPIGYMAATIFASPGTAVRAAILWATAAQVSQLTWSEVPYRLVRLDDARFFMDEADVEVDQLFTYVNRFGSFCMDGSPVALAAIPARNRTAAALTQEELLDVAARMVIGRNAGGEDLVRAIFEDYPGVTERASETVWPSSRQLQSRWTPFPASRRP